MLPNEKLPSQVKEFSAENCSNGSLAKVAKFHTNPYNFVACLPNPCKLSVLDDIWRATILPFSSSEHLHSWLRLSNLVDLSFEYLSLSNKRKTTTLFPSPLTFLQWPMNVKWQMVVRVSVNIWLEKYGNWPQQYSCLTPPIKNGWKISYELWSVYFVPALTALVPPEVIGLQVWPLTSWHPNRLFYIKSTHESR